MKRRTSFPSLIAVGSVALDSIKTEHADRRDILGGSASFACAAASFFTLPGMVGIVGADFPEKFLKLFRRLGIDVAGLRRAPGRTFRWSGVYERDMNVRRTLSTHLNVFSEFSPELPAAYTEAPFVFLANISPQLQLQVLAQARRPLFTAADTMDLWIRTERKPLLKVVSKVDMLLINDSEARDLAGCGNTVLAAERLARLGPKYIVIKKGEHGCMLFSRNRILLLPAFPVRNLQDPTGAGDSFAGGLLGRLAQTGKTDWAEMKEALLAATVMGSFCVEAFSLDRFAKLKKTDISRRLAQFRRML